MSAIEWPHARQNPVLSQVAPNSEPSLPFELLLQISPAVSRAMKSPVQLPKLLAFIETIGFNCDHKNMVHIGDIRIVGEGTERETEHCVDALFAIEAQRVAHMEFNPNVYATFYAPKRWPDYYVIHTHDNDAVNVNRLHLCKVV